MFKSRDSRFALIFTVMFVFSISYFVWGALTYGFRPPLEILRDIGIIIGIGVIAWLVVAWIFRGNDD